MLDSGAGGARLAAFLVPDAPDALHSLAEAGIPAFRTPESCADAVAAAWSRRPPSLEHPSLEHPGRQYAAGAGRLIDELAAYALLASLGVPSARCAELAEGTRPEVPFPVAVKILSDEIAHKSDCGGVALAIQDPAGLAQAAEQVRHAVAHARPDVRGARLLVQQMVHGVGEALVGYRWDPQVGPVVLLAAGGTAAEVHRDRSVRTAPVDLATAHGMIDEVAGFVLLKGFRGRPCGDIAALARAVVALSSLAVRPGPQVLEFEVNPLIVLEDGQGVVAVDACAWMAFGPRAEGTA